MGEPKGLSNFSPNPATPREAKEKAELLKAQINQLKEKFILKYKIDVNDPTVYPEGDLYKLVEVFGSLDNLKGKRILDIGCGSVNSVDRERNYESRSFEPWFCRLLKELGADPVGIDINPDIGQEEFENHRLNLITPGELNIFPDKSFDGINLAGLFDSPFLNRGRFTKDDILKMKEEIGTQIKRLLKDDGKLITIKRFGDDNLKAELGLL